MQREWLRPLDGQKVLVCGRRGRISCIGGCTDAYRIVLEDIEIDGAGKLDHAWVKPKKGLQAKKGEWVAFRATVSKYIGLDENGNHVEKFGFKKLRHICVAKTKEEAMDELRTRDHHQK